MKKTGKAFLITTIVVVAIGTPLYLQKEKIVDYPQLKVALNMAQSAKEEVVKITKNTTGFDLAPYIGVNQKKFIVSNTISNLPDFMDEEPINHKNKKMPNQSSSSKKAFEAKTDEVNKEIDSLLENINTPKIDKIAKNNIPVSRSISKNGIKKDKTPTVTTETKNIVRTSVNNSKYIKEIEKLKRQLEESEEFRSLIQKELVMVNKKMASFEQTMDILSQQIKESDKEQKSFIKKSILKNTNEINKKINNRVSTLNSKIKNEINKLPTKNNVADSILENNKVISDEMNKNLNIIRLENKKVSKKIEMVSDTVNILKAKISMTQKMLNTEVIKSPTHHADVITSKLPDVIENPDVGFVYLGYSIRDNKRIGYIANNDNLNDVYEIDSESIINQTYEVKKMTSEELVLYDTKKFYKIILNVK